MRKTKRMATAVSVRERDQIREAAKVAGVSPSKYLRVTALERAQEVLNGDGQDAESDD